MLYCALTGQLMDKSLEAVKRHMAGKKFQRNKGEKGDHEGGHGVGRAAYKSGPEGWV